MRLTETKYRNNDMKKTRLNFRQLRIDICVLSLVMAAGFTSTSFAQPQFDAPYYEFQKLRGDEWAMEDKVIDEKLAALEKKFGKKPNIIYILTDDIGHGELGWAMCPGLANTFLISSAKKYLTLRKKVCL
jgi:hypothetical protein